MTKITPAEMQRELIAYAHDEMFNRGVEAAAILVDRCANSYRTGGDILHGLSKHIRAQKRKPEDQLSDWWGTAPTHENAMRGLFESLTPEQQAAALAYDGPENLGSQYTELEKASLRKQAAIGHEMAREEIERRRDQN